MTLKHHSLLLGLVLFSYACGSSSDDKKSSAEPELPGDWSTGCLKLEVDGAKEDQERTFSATKTAFTETLNVFNYTNTSKCDTKQMTRVVKGTYTEPASNSSDHKFINMVLSSVSLSISDDATITSFNDDSVCGGNWEKGKEKSLTKTNCANNGKNLPYAGITLYDIYAIEDGKLSFGSTSGLPTGSDDRPTSLDGAISFENL